MHTYALLNDNTIVCIYGPVLDQELTAVYPVGSNYKQSYTIQTKCIVQTDTNISVLKNKARLKESIAQVDKGEYFQAISYKGWLADYFDRDLDRLGYTLGQHFINCFVVDETTVDPLLWEQSIIKNAENMIYTHIVKYNWSYEFLILKSDAPYGEK